MCCCWPPCSPPAAGLGGRTSPPSSSLLWQVAHKLTQLLFTLTVGIAGEDPTSSDRSRPQPTPLSQVRSSPWHPGPLYLPDQRSHKADGVRSSLASVLWLCHLQWPRSSRRLGSPQLQSVPLTFKRNPMGANLGAGWVASATGARSLGKGEGC